MESIHKGNRYLFSNLDPKHLVLIILIMNYITLSISKPNIFHNYEYIHYLKLIYLEYSQINCKKLSINLNLIARHA